MLCQQGRLLWKAVQYILYVRIEGIEWNEWNERIERAERIERVGSVISVLVSRRRLCCDVVLAAQCVYERLAPRSNAGPNVCGIFGDFGSCPVSILCPIHTYWQKLPWSRICVRHVVAQEECNAAARLGTQGDCSFCQLSHIFVLLNEKAIDAPQRICKFLDYVLCSLTAKPK
jgi:hypothetical protein